MTYRLLDGNITKSLSNLLSKRTFEKDDLLDATPMKTVLIVEDDPINARVFSKILSKRGGLNVKHTEDVEEVMQIAQAGAADIILMDVSLAHSVYRGKAVDGIKITQLLKADAQTSNLPIILVTAHAMEGDRENFLKQSGADGYISKPVVDHQQFVDQIMALLSKST
jgi:CheY-like chemotaxis protein